MSGSETRRAGTADATEVVLTAAYADDADEDPFKDILAVPEAVCCCFRRNFTKAIMLVLAKRAFGWDVVGFGLTAALYDLRMVMLGDDEVDSSETGNITGYEVHL